MPASPMKNPPTVAVIGAGISGLSCANALAAAGVSVTVFEKSRSLGGRCATRKWGDHIVDHGAQYFTIRDAAFRAELEARCGDQLRMIAAGILDAAGREILSDDPRWYHGQGNNRIGKALRGDLPVRMETAVGRIEPAGGRWIVAGEGFDRVVSSAPWPQTAALCGLDAGEAEFDPCLTAFFSYRGEGVGNVGRVYARKDAAADLAWSACENHKVGRIAAGETVFVAQASPGFSAMRLEDEPEDWAAALRADLETSWGLSAETRLATFTHRWRYARCVRRLPKTLDLPEGIFVTGDGRSESRVESAWLAGRATAGEVLAGI